MYFVIKEYDVFSYHLYLPAVSKTFPSLELKVMHNVVKLIHDKIDCIKCHYITNTMSITIALYNEGGGNCK